jgi:hypothetical protein
VGLMSYQVTAIDGAAAEETEDDDDDDDDGKTKACQAVDDEGRSSALALLKMSLSQIRCPRPKRTAIRG